MKVQIVIPKLGFVLLMVMLNSFFKFCKKEGKSIQLPSSASIQKSPNNTSNEQSPKPELNPRVANPPAANPSSNKPKIETPGSDPAEKQHSSDSDHDKNNGDGGNGGDHGESLGSNGGDAYSNDNIGIQNKLPDNQPVLGGLHANTDVNANLALVNNDQGNIVVSLNTMAGSPKVVTRSISPSPSFQSSASKSMSGRVRGTPKSDDVHSIASCLSNLAGKAAKGLSKLFIPASATQKAYDMMGEAQRRRFKAEAYANIAMYVCGFIPEGNIKAYADAAGNSVAAAQRAFDNLKVKVKNVEDAEKALLKAKAYAALQEVDKHLKDLTKHKNSAKNVLKELGTMIKNMDNKDEEEKLQNVLNEANDCMNELHENK